VFRERFSGPRWEDLAGAGANLQRPLWASTSTKNPAYSPTLYVDQLIGRDTVNTLAQASLEALAHDDGLRADTVCEGLDEARAAIGGLAEAGVDFDDVTATLEREGVAAFSASYHDALSSLEKKARRLT
jgi:transaldolase